MIIAWIALAMAVAALATATLALLWTVRPPTKRTDTRHRLETEIIDRTAIDAEIAKQGIPRSPAVEPATTPRTHAVQDVVARLLHN